MGRQHGLVVLLLVLDDHAEGEPVLGEAPPLQRHPLEHVERLVPHLLDVLTRLRRAEQRQRRPVRARMLEGVVQVVDVRAQRLAAADVPDQPQLLLAADVREVPDQR